VKKSLKKLTVYRKIQATLPHNFLFDNVGIGDIVAALPALKYICDFHPHVIPYVWCPDFIYPLVQRALPKKCIVRPFAQKHKYNATYAGKSFSCEKHTSLGTSLIDHAFSCFLNTIPDIEYKNYLSVDTSDINTTNFNLPEKFVILTTGFTAPVRELLLEHCNRIITYIKSKGYEVVFLGKEEAFNGIKYTIKGNFKEEINFHEGVNLVNKTSLLESLAIIKKAKALVGLDNGLMHLAAMTDISIIGGFTTVEPKFRIPVRHSELGWNFYSVVPPKSLACRFCQSNMQLTYQFDFRQCFYNDKACLDLLNADLYINELEKVL
jgi:Glycosyltransferase family 9 (heptosyltransferase)